ncbi:MAG TPA: Uma2 family endonuclease [Thermomicrobiales bacterium]|nr:Uma2 family endonuclease [Thermomicrobiales bacterium]
MSTALARYRISAAEFARMGEAGVFPAERRLELVDGEVVEMSSIGPRHGNSVASATDVLAGHLAGRWTLRVQSPLQLGPHDVPQPDLALVTRRNYGDAHPTAADALLVIEVADTSLLTDRRDKLPRYAAAGIPETWLLDLAGGRLERHSEPGLAGYQQVQSARRRETLGSTVLPGLTFDVTGLLGP